MDSNGWILCDVNSQSNVLSSRFQVFQNIYPQAAADGVTVAVPRKEASGKTHRQAKQTAEVLYMVVDHLWPALMETSLYIYLLTYQTWM